MLVFGGYTNRNVWALPLAERPIWTQLLTVGWSPSPRSQPSVIYDPVRDRMLVFGGYGSEGMGVEHNDVWALPLSGLNWVQLAPSGALPAGRGPHTAPFDAVPDRMVRDRRDYFRRRL